jgi:hypothetical protein
VALEESGALTGYRASRLEQLQSDAAMLICNLQVQACPPQCQPAAGRLPAPLLMLMLPGGVPRFSRILAACSPLLPLLLPTLCYAAGCGR